MPRKPLPGSDQGTWGNVLNEFLDVSHSGDGTLKAAVVGTTQLQDGSVTEAKLSAALQAKVNSTGSIADGSVTTAKLADGAVTDAKVTSVAQSKVTGLSAALDGKASTTAVEAKYTKPTGGIPEADLDAAVQTKLNSSGAIADGSVTTTKLADGAVTDAKVASGIAQSKVANLTTDLAGKYTKPGAGIPATDLASSVQTSLATADARDAVKLQGHTVDGSAPADGQILVYSTTSSSWVPNTSTTTTVSDATTTTKGLVQLAGDLGGTASAPTVPGLAGKINATEKGAVNGVATLGSDGKVPAAQLPAATTVSDATTTSKGVVQLAGDLGGTAAAPTVPGLAGKVGTTRAIATGTGLAGGGDLSADRTLSVVNDSTVQKVELSVAGTLVGTRKRINLIQGSNVTLTTADDATNNKIDVTISSSGGGTGGSVFTTVNKTANYTANTMEIVICDATASGFTVTLPTVTNGAMVRVKKVDSSTNAIIVAPQGGVLIDNSASASINTQWQSNDFVSDGVKWYFV